MTPSQATSQDAILQRIEAALDEHVRPSLRGDGGDVDVVAFDEDRVLQVRMKGACVGCASSTITLTMLIESKLKAVIPEIRFIEAVL